MRKWLKGEAIPTMDKLAVLANLLDISEDWLRWGNDSMQESSTKHSFKVTQIASTFDPEKALVQDYRLLSKVHKKLIDVILEVLLKEQSKSKKSEP